MGHRTLLIHLAISVVTQGRMARLSYRGTLVAKSHLSVPVSQVIACNECNDVFPAGPSVCHARHKI